jgi:hypothetical protein
LARRIQNGGNLVLVSLIEHQVGAGYEYERYAEPARRAGVLDRLLLSLNLSRPVRLSLRNTFRRRGRLLLTLLTLALGGALFVSILTVRTSLLASLDGAAAQRWLDALAAGKRYRSSKLNQAGQAGLDHLL